MSDTDDWDGGPAGYRSGLTMRHLGSIRWIALSGQLVAILFVHFGLGYSLPLAACLALVAASAALGLWKAVSPGRGRRIGRRTTLGLLAFDTVQLFLLLYLTGGLANPFSVLFLAPVTVSAMVFPRRVTMGLVSLTVVLLTVLAFRHLPLPWPGGFELAPMYTFGLWAALVLATVFVASYAGFVSSESYKLAQALAEARLTHEREQKMVSLGALAAAAAHKLGSPLNTITLIAHEMDRLAGTGARPETDDHFMDDIRQLKEETERCRRILAELNDEALLLGPETAEPVELSAFVGSLMEERFPDISGMLEVEVAGGAGQEPRVVRRPELIHPVETLVDNAAQFAAGKVRIALSWDEERFSVAVRDDGPGFTSSVLSRLGTPYASTRGGKEGHMGLGVFIAMTMMENIGGGLRVDNLEAGGAEAVLTYPRAEFDPGTDTDTEPAPETADGAA